MDNIVSIRKGGLPDLASQINLSIEKAKGDLVQIATLLAQARKQCKKEGVTWTEWVRSNINLSRVRANQLARIGDAPDPARALADHRDYVRERNLVANVRSRTPKPGVPIEVEDEDQEWEDPTPPSQLPDSMRIRGLMHRAMEAKEMAEADDMAGIEPTDAMRDAVSNAAKAWIELLAKLEGD